MRKNNANDQKFVQLEMYQNGDQKVYKNAVNKYNANIYNSAVVKDPNMKMIEVNGGDIMFIQDSSDNNRLSNTNEHLELVKSDVNIADYSEEPTIKI